MVWIHQLKDRYWYILTVGYYSGIKRHDCQTMNTWLTFKCLLLSEESSMKGYIIFAVTYSGKNRIYRPIKQVSGCLGKTTRDFLGLRKYFVWCYNGEYKKLSMCQTPWDFMTKGVA